MSQFRAVVIVLMWFLGVYLLCLWAVTAAGCSVVYHPGHRPGDAQIEADKVVQPLCFMDCNSGTHNLKSDDNHGSVTAGSSTYTKQKAEESQ